MGGHARGMGTDAWKRWVGLQLSCAVRQAVDPVAHRASASRCIRSSSAARSAALAAAAAASAAALAAASRAPSAESSRALVVMRTVAWFHCRERII